MSRTRSRWWLVAVAAAAMGVAGTYQFMWSSLRTDLGSHLGASEAALGTAFTIFVLAQTLTQLPAGRVRDRRGPRAPLVVGAVAVTGGYVGAAYATTVPQVYLSYALGGVGAGVLYTVAVNTPVKWFRERRGLATGAVTMAYGGVSVALIPGLREGLARDFSGTLLALGAGAGAVGLLALAVLRDPDAGEGANAVRAEDDDGRPADHDDEQVVPGDGAAERGDSRDDTARRTERDGGTAETDAHTWRETVRTPQFWHMYLVFVVVNGVGLMVIGKAVSLAGGLGLSAAVATATASAVAFSDSAGILVIAGLSDRLGPERTVAGSLTLCGVSLAAALALGNAGLGVAFVVLVGAMAFFRSPVFAIFPAIVGSYYGESHSSENYALLYTSKVWGGVIGGVIASLLVDAVGWTPAFLLGAAVMTAAGVSVFFLRPA